MKFYFVYTLLCNDKTYYTGMTNNLERRIMQHKSGHKKESYTAKRLPIKLLWYLQCENPGEAIKLEKQIKGWSQRKKKALIDENWQDLIEFSKNYRAYNIRI